MDGTMKMNRVDEGERAFRLGTAFLFAMVLVFAMALFSTSAAWAETISGNCGPEDNPEAVTWTLTDAGTLTVSGTGPMGHFDSYFKDYWDNRKTVKKLVVKEGVASIGESAFEGFQHIETATLPNSLRTIGEAAFASCMCLNDIKIPAGVKSIPSSAFSACVNLSSITLPDTINSIGIEAFMLCPCLKKVNYQGTLAQWKKVSIAAGNNAFKNASLTYKKLAQPMKVKAKTASASVKKLAKAKRTIAISKALTFTTKAQGTVTYAKVSGSAKLSIAKATGKITVKKGTKKGTYKIKVKVTAAGNATYKAGSKTLTLKVKVK